MSDPSATASFQRAQWASVASEKAPKQPASAASSASAFTQMVTPAKKGTKAASFESPYISENKLREILEADQRNNPPEAPDVEEVKQQAYSDGFAKGEADGFNAGKQQVAPILAQLQQMLVDIDGLWKNMVSRYERQFMDLICRVAEKIVFGHVEIDQETVKRAILDAFSIVPEPVGVTIEVNPKDYDYIEAIKEDFFDCISSLKDVSVSSDPSVARGGCKIRTSAGEVDATLQSRLEAVRKCFLEANGQTR